MLVREIEALMSGFVEDTAFKGTNTVVLIYAEFNGKRQYIGLDGKPTTDREKAFPYMYDDDNVSEQLRQCAAAGMPMKCEARDKVKKAKKAKKAKAND